MEERTTELLRAPLFLCTSSSVTDYYFLWPWRVGRHERHCKSEKELREVVGTVIESMLMEVTEFKMDDR